jgi:hypothetical protein
MTYNATNFTEASLADQIYSRGDDGDTGIVDCSKSLRCLGRDELGLRGDLRAAEDLKRNAVALKNSRSNRPIDFV